EAGPRQERDGGPAEAASDLCAAERWTDHANADEGEPEKCACDDGSRSRARAHVPACRAAQDPCPEAACRSECCESDTEGEADSETIEPELRCRPARRDDRAKPGRQQRRL